MTDSIKNKAEPAETAEDKQKVNDLAMGALTLLERVNISGKEAESYLVIRNWLSTFVVQQNPSE